MVFVDTFSGWTEAFPVKTETAKVIAKKLLGDILPRYEFPLMGSEYGQAFVSKVSQDVARFIGADWKLPTFRTGKDEQKIERDLN